VRDIQFDGKEGMRKEIERNYMSASPLNAVPSYNITSNIVHAKRKDH
jgi:hypothetical protein